MNFGSDDTWQKHMSYINKGTRITQVFSGLNNVFRKWLSTKFTCTWILPSILYTPIKQRYHFKQTRACTTFKIFKPHSDIILCFTMWNGSHNITQYVIPTMHCSTFCSLNIWQIMAFWNKSTDINNIT